MPDGERGAGVDADERLLDGDRTRIELLDQVDDAVEDRLEPQLGALLGGRLPPAELHRLQAASSSLDDAESASSRTRVDAENRHADTLGTVPDVPAPKTTSLLPADSTEVPRAGMSLENSTTTSP